VGIRNLRQFHLGLDRFAKKIEEHGVAFQKKVAFMLLGAYVSVPGVGITAVVGVLQLTPVDTGRAVGNWQLSVGSPANTELTDIGKGSGGSGRSQAIAGATRRAVPALSGLRLGQSIFLVDNVAYIVVLNDGAENRVANHMVERSMANTRRALRSGLG